MNSHGAQSTISLPYDYRHYDITKTVDRKETISFECDRVDLLPIEILIQKIGGFLFPLLIQYDGSTGKKMPQETRTQPTVQQIVFKLVLVTAQAAVTRPVTITLFENP